MDLSRIWQYYDQWKDLYDDLQTLGMAQDFAFWILRSAKKDHDGRPTRYDVVCVCHGNAPTEKLNRRRKERSTLKYDCPFTAKAVYRRKEKLW